MTATLQDKMQWIDRVWHALNCSLQEGRDTDSSKEAIALTDELVQGFTTCLLEVKRLCPQAASEFYEWAVNHEEAGSLLVGLDPMKSIEAPGEWHRLLQDTIPQKFIDYLFCAGMSLYTENEHLKADKAFRLLTVLFPQNPNYWLWLGYAQFMRRLPEYALISFTLASCLIIRNPFIQFYIAECWIQLKAWDQARQNLYQTLELIQHNPAFGRLKVKCEEFLSMINSSLFTSDNDYQLQQMLFIVPNLTVAPREALRNLQANRVPVSTSPTLQSQDFAALFSQFERKTKALEEALNQVKQRLQPEVSIVGYFETKSIKINADKVTIPLTQFLQKTTAACSFFFGALIVGMAISSMNKKIKELILMNNPMRIAYTFSGLLDQSDTSAKQGINKYVYTYNPQMDVAFNQLMINPEYGSTFYSYQELHRQDNRIRASRFLPQDIEGKSLLDFGCNQGGILFACRNLGATAITGVDLNPWCISQAEALVKEQKIQDATFYVGDMENRALLSSLPQADTVFLLAILDTSVFVNKTAVIANVSRFAKQALYYEGHVTNDSHVPRMYEFLIATDFTRFEYLGRFEGRVLIRCSRELIDEASLPAGAITSDAEDKDLLNAQEIYLFTDSPCNPPFSRNCRLIQFVRR